MRWAEDTFRAVAGLAGVLMITAPGVSLAAAESEEGFWYVVTDRGYKAYPLCELSAEVQECGRGWIHAVDWCFRRVGSLSTYDEAAELCRSQGATLAAAMSMTENQVIQEACGDAVCWLGLAWSEALQMWRWSHWNFTEPVFTNWADGEDPDWHEGATWAAAVINPPDDTEEEYGEDAWGDFFGFCFFATIWSLVAWRAIEGCLICWSCSARDRMIRDASHGHWPLQPSGGMRCCCGSIAILYWEGPSHNFWVSYLVCSCFACCCWDLPRLPLVDGKPVQVVGPAVAVQAAPGMTQFIGRPVEGSAGPGVVVAAAPRPAWNGQPFVEVQAPVRSPSSKTP